MMTENNKMEDLLYYCGISLWSDQETVRFDCVF